MSYCILCEGGNKTERANCKHNDIGNKVIKAEMTHGQNEWKCLICSDKTATFFWINNESFCPDCFAMNHDCQQVIVNQEETPETELISKSTDQYFREFIEAELKIEIEKYKLIYGLIERKNKDKEITIDFLEGMEETSYKNICRMQKELNKGEKDAN